MTRSKRLWGWFAKWAMPIFGRVLLLQGGDKGELSKVAESSNLERAIESKLRELVQIPPGYAFGASEGKKNKMMTMILIICPYCDGTGEGRHEGQICPACKGKGY